MKTIIITTIGLTIGLAFGKQIGNESDKPAFYTVWQDDFLIGCATPIQAKIYQKLGFETEQHQQKDEGTDFWYETILSRKSCQKIISKN